jgi:putative ABC transport system permease protein
MGIRMALRARLVASQLFGLAHNDPATIAAAACLMLAMAGMAVYVPARRAARTDPMSVLRYE